MKFGQSGGGGGIRTPETLSSLTVFKTAGFNRSPTPPPSILTCWPPVITSLCALGFVLLAPIRNLCPSSVPSEIPR